MNSLDFFKSKFSSFYLARFVAAELKEMDITPTPAALGKDIK